MKKSIFILFILIIGILVMVPKNTYAYTNGYVLTTTNSQDVNEYINSVKSGNVYKQDASSCNSLLGNPNEPDSVAWLLYKILNYMRVLGPLAVIVLSGIEFTKAIVNSDDDTMKKATGHLKTRLIMAALLFLIPTITKLLFQVFGIATDCGILN
ncbi:MAG: hypothetical protein IJL76_03325 [Bacilli bacterium]|nr:hypothetical protein [Bacilli bacterium]